MGLHEERFPIADLHCESCVGPIICAVTGLEGVENAEIDMSVEPPELVVESSLGTGAVTLAQISGALEVALQNYATVGEK